MVASPNQPVPNAEVASTLRALLDHRRNEGTLLTLGEAAAVLVPLCLDLQQRHAQGEQVLVHPSCIEPQSNGLARYIAGKNGQPVAPHHPRDRACTPPELMATMALRLPSPGMPPEIVSSPALT